VSETRESVWISAAAGNDSRMYIGVGTIVLILLIILIVMMLRRA